MGNYNINNTLLVNIREVLTCLFNTSYPNIAWVIRSVLEYLKDLKVVGPFTL